jgi:hypothetical protein
MNSRMPRLRWAVSIALAGAFFAFASIIAQMIDRGQRDAAPAASPGRVSSSGSQSRGKVMSDDDLKAELERLRRENAALKKGASSSVRMKVSEKGAVSIYGLGRFPVTLYKEQWLKLLEMADDIRVFIAENESQLKAKDQ